MGVDVLSVVQNKMSSVPLLIQGYYEFGNSTQKKRKIKEENVFASG